MTDTKQITFEGQTYTVPVWVKWVARNYDGEKNGFDHKPKIFGGFFFPVEG